MFKDNGILKNLLSDGRIDRIVRLIGIQEHKKARKKNNKTTIRRDEKNKNFRPRPLFKPNVRVLWNSLFAGWTNMSSQLMGVIIHISIIAIS